jgi:hypothetical protein
MEFVQERGIGLCYLPPLFSLSTAWFSYKIFKFKESRVQTLRPSPSNQCFLALPQFSEFLWIPNIARLIGNEDPCMDGRNLLSGITVTVLRLVLDIGL